MTHAGRISWLAGAHSSLPIVEGLESADCETPAAALSDLQRKVFSALQAEGKNHA